MIDQDQADKMRVKMEKFFKSLTRDEQRLLRRASERQNGRKESALEMMTRLGANKNSPSQPPASPPNDQ